MRKPSAVLSCRVHNPSMSTLSQLQSEEAELVEDLAVCRLAVQAFSQSGIAATVAEFTIGRTTVKFRDIAQATMALASIRKQLRELREDIRGLQQSNAAIQMTGGGGFVC